MLNEELPLSPKQAIKAHSWLQSNFKQNIDTALLDTDYSPEIVSAIFCQETAQRVLLWVDNYDAETILKRCVFDASGDFPHTTRKAFPKNAGEFKNKYGEEFTNILIDEANKMRAMPQPGNSLGYAKADYLYKGYGLFQYDLQNVLTDEAYFSNKLWYSFDECISRLINHLDVKSKAHDNDLWQTVKAYNGSGSAAGNYANNVFEFVDIIKKSV